VLHDGPKIIVALDMSSEAEAFQLTQHLNPQQCRLKVGKELFVSCGTSIVTHLINEGFDIFLDLKFHDIPNTVAKACLAAYDLGVWMTTVHCAGGRKMLEAAVAALAPLSGPKPLLVGVTVLTSLSDADLLEIGIHQSVSQQVTQMAKLAQHSGLDGIVCSPQEAAAMKKLGGAEFLCVTPGVRLPENKADDQQRVMTPQQAIQQGADYLVIGRPITQAENPAQMLEKIIASLP
jgi:orotidine-5'-phosphate decarboxylase